MRTHRSLRRSAAALLGAALLSAAAAPAWAQTPEKELGSARGFASGELVVTFHSDPATCASTGACGLDGTMRWSMDGATRLGVTESGGKTRFALGGVGRDDGGVVVRRRTASGAVRVCTDTAPPFQGTLITGAGGVTAGAPATVRLIGENAVGVASLCPGPLLEDLAAYTPAATVDFAALRRGNVRLDLRGERSFVAHGLAIALRSTVVVDVGRVNAARATDSGRPSTDRTLASVYTVERVDGDVRFASSGPADPAACVLVDACGARATTVLAPRATSGTVRLVASASTKVSRRALLVALGLAEGKDDERVELGLLGSFDGGVASTEVVREDAQGVCRDTRPLKTGSVIGVGDSDGLAVSYLPFPEPRSRCGTPLVPFDLFSPGTVANVLSRADARRDRIVLRFDRASQLELSGFPTAVTPDLTVTLRRKSRRAVTYP